MEELEQLDKVEQLRREQLAALLPNTPHPFCPCGRSLNEHLEDDIRACEDLRVLLRDFNPRPLIARSQSGKHLLFAVANLYRELPDQERQQRGLALLKKIRITLGSQLTMFEPFQDLRQPTRLEEDRRMPPFGRPPWHDGKLN